MGHCPYRKLQKVKIRLFILFDSEFDILDNPVVLVRDLLLYPSPVDPHASAGWLRRQTSLGGPIEHVGEFLNFLLYSVLIKTYFSECCSTSGSANQNYRKSRQSFDSAIGL